MAEEQPEGFRYRAADPGPPLRYIRARAMDLADDNQALWMIAWALLEVRDAIRELQINSSPAGLANALEPEDADDAD